MKFYTVLSSALLGVVGTAVVLALHHVQAATPVPATSSNEASSVGGTTNIIQGSFSNSAIIQGSGNRVTIDSRSQSKSTRVQSATSSGSISQSCSDDGCVTLYSGRAVVKFNNGVTCQVTKSGLASCH